MLVWAVSWMLPRSYLKRLGDRVAHCLPAPAAPAAGRRRLRQILVPPFSHSTPIHILWHNILFSSKARFGTNLSYCLWVPYLTKAPPLLMRRLFNGYLFIGWNALCVCNPFKNILFNWHSIWLARRAGSAKTSRHGIHFIIYVHYYSQTAYAPEVDSNLLINSRQRHSMRGDLRWDFYAI